MIGEMEKNGDRTKQMPRELNSVFWVQNDEAVLGQEG